MVSLHKHLPPAADLAPLCYNSVFQVQLHLAIIALAAGFCLPQYKITSASPPCFNEMGSLYPFFKYSSTVLATKAPSGAAAGAMRGGTRAPGLVALN